MSDLNDLSRPVTTDTEPNVLDTLRAHIVRAATWAGWGSTASKVAGIMSAVTATVSGGLSMRLYRSKGGNSGDDEIISLPGISIGGNAATASGAQAGSALANALSAKAPVNSPSFTGTPTVPTAAAGTNTTQAASTAFVRQEVANVVGSSPAALDTLNELAAALGNDANFAGTVNTALGNRVTKTSANRPGVTKLYRNDHDSDFNVQITWQADRNGYWSIRGYSGDTYHAPVYVGYAGYADSAGAVAWANVSGKPTFSAVSTSGSYADLSGRPALSTVATSGSYTDLSNKPTIPTVPSSVSAFVNDAGYVTSSVGVGQSWIDVTSSRSAAVTYTNSTGRPIYVIVGVQAVSGSPNAKISIAGVTVIDWSFPYGNGQPLSFIVPNGGTYLLTLGAGTQLVRWVELR